MSDWVVDKGLDVLLAQINAAAPNRSKASDGSIGDADHQARTSDHNPQDTTDSADGNDPDNQVDARDFTHDPAHNADMGTVSESIRQSHERRVQYVIFNRRMFYSRDRDGIPAFTWRAYSGDDPHDSHMHVSVNDYHNDETQPWKIGIDAMATLDEIGNWAKNTWGGMFYGGKSCGKPLPDGSSSMFAKLDHLIKQVDDVKAALAAPTPVQVDPVALASALRPIVREELDKTTLGVAG